MASIENLSLQLESRPTAVRGAVLRIRYRVRLSARERRLPGLRFKEKVRLFGADRGFLYELNPACFPSSPKGQVWREHLVAVNGRVLERAADGLHAEVWVTPRLAEPRRSAGPSLALSF